MEEEKLSLKKDESDIPNGPYCYTYDENGKIEVCPFYDTLKNMHGQENGFCHYLQMGDKDLDLGFLWDMCKECGINYNHKENK